MSAETAQRRPGTLRSLRTAATLALATSVIAAVVGAWTALDPGLLHGPAAMRGSARGTALVLLVVAVPMLVVSVLRATRGSGPALLTWGGALLYVVYNSVLLLFLTPFNAAFLAYVAMLGCAGWAVGLLLAVPRLWSVGAELAQGPRVRAISAYVLVVVALNTVAWLSRVLPALDDPYPTPMLDGTGVPTNAIYVQDLAGWLPLAAVAATWLARRKAAGAVVVGALLAMWVVEGLSVAVDQWWGASADPGSPVVSKALVLPFLVLAAVGLVPLMALVRGRAAGPEGSVPAHATLPAGGRQHQASGERNNHG
jgi:hypothetical protein